MPSTSYKAKLEDDTEGQIRQESGIKNREVENPPGPGPGHGQTSNNLFNAKIKSHELEVAIQDPMNNNSSEFSNPIYSVQFKLPSSPQLSKKNLIQTSHTVRQGYVFDPTVATAVPTNSFVGLTPPPIPHMMEYNSEQSSSFTQTFLRGILTSIDSKDPVVANAWLETLLDAIDLLPIDVIKQEIIIIAVNKSQLSQPVFSRIAACKMLGKLSTKLDQQSVRQEVLPSTLALCQDVESKVRNCMCKHLPMIARGIGLDLTKSAILPILVELSNDESSEVRLSAFETVVHLLSLLDDEVCNSTIVPLVIKCCDQAKFSLDCSLPVIARHLGRLCHGLTPNLSPDQKSWLVSYFQQLSKIGTANSTEVPHLSISPMPDLVPVEKAENNKAEQFVECRQACAYNLPGMVLFVGVQNFTDTLLTTFCDLATDPSPLVRRKLASGLHELIKIIGSNFSLIKVQVVSLFNDNNIEVLSVMVFNMVYVIDALARFGVLQFGSTGSYSQDLSIAILHMEDIINSTRNWRLHADCLEKLSCLANCISATVIQQKYIPLLFMRAHKSRPLPCRVAAVRTLLVILRFTVKLEDRVYIITKIKDELANGRSCHSRMLFLKMCEMAIMLFSRSYFKLNFFMDLLFLSKDPVANIRMKVVSMLPQLKSLLSLPSDRPHLHFLEDSVKELMIKEHDRDVLNSLQTAIHYLAEIETAVDGKFLTLGTFNEDDMDDERKLREERLIANMEEQIKQVQGSKFDQLMTPSVIPSRLKSMGMDRKRSESLPPAFARAENLMVDRVRYTSPELPRRMKQTNDDEQHEMAPSYSNEITTRNLWPATIDKREANVPALVIKPYSSSLENLDPNTQEFFIDAGIKLPLNGHMSSAASMPNLTSIGKIKENIVRSSSIPDNSNIDGELTKYLISNEEMELYEAEYEKTAQDLRKEVEVSPKVLQPMMETCSERRQKSVSRMKPPSFTSASISKTPTKSTSLSNELEREETLANISQREESKPSDTHLGRPSSSLENRKSPSNFEDKMLGSQKWNDGSVERLAEKWAAKRDTLLKETGIIAENLQQRKAAMEQKLESVKKSIPKRNVGLGSQTTQKRLSLCDAFRKSKIESNYDETKKRKSLDIDIVLPPDTTAFNADDAFVSRKITEIRSSKAFEGKNGKYSPEQGSSDSDESLPPYPIGDNSIIDIDAPLPPPPISMKKSNDLIAHKKSMQSLNQSQISAPQNKLMLSYSEAKYKTVSAPQTSVAKSRALKAPQPRIADSPKLPIKSILKVPESKPRVLTFKKPTIEDSKEEEIMNESKESNTVHSENATNRLIGNIRLKSSMPVPDNQKICRSVKKEEKLYNEIKHKLNKYTPEENPSRILRIPCPSSMSNASTVQKTFTTFKGKQIASAGKNTDPIIRNLTPSKNNSSNENSVEGSTLNFSGRQMETPFSKMQRNTLTKYVPHIVALNAEKNQEKSLKEKTHHTYSKTNMFSKIRQRSPNNHSSKDLEGCEEKSSPDKQISSKSQNKNPKKGNGLRMWQKEPKSNMQSSPDISRSPSPSTKLRSETIISGKITTNHTLPRGSNITRLRASNSQNSGPPQQRRSYGGVTSFQGGKSHKNASAPNTPRQSQNDLSQPRSIHSSPSRSRSNSPANNQSSKNNLTLEYKSKKSEMKIPSMTKSIEKTRNPMKTKSYTEEGMMRASGLPQTGQSLTRPGSSSHIQTQSSIRAPKGSTASIKPPHMSSSQVLGNGLRLPTPHKAFGFKHN